jgi:hypothetical protein
MLGLFFVLSIAGVVGMMAGVAARAVATSREWAPGSRSRSARHIEAGLIIFAVCFWIASDPILFPILEGGFHALGMDWGQAFYVAATLLLSGNVLCGAVFGWIIGPDRSPRLQRNNPFGDGPNNPFNGPDSETSPFDFTGGGTNSPPNV